MLSQKRQNDPDHFQGKPFNTTVIQVYAPTTKAKASEVEWFYDDIQDLQKICPFTIEDCNTTVGNQEMPGVTGKFGLGVQNKEGQRLTEFCQENGHNRHPFSTTQETTVHIITRWSLLK